MSGTDMLDTAWFLGPVMAGGRVLINGVKDSRLRSENLNSR